MKLSACMMVKNEEEHLQRCLDSIGFCDEIIVVDTGSTDNTVRIAESFGANVYYHPWENNFSTHRNQSIGYSSGDWILIIDADEEIASDMSLFKKRLERVKENALVLNIKEINSGRDTTTWLGMRFFRRSSGIHYKYAVHNKAVFDGHAAMTDIQMNHYGYSLSPEKMAAKRKRTGDMLLARIAADPKDHAAYYYLTQLHVGAKDYKGAETYGLKFFETVPVGPDKFEFYSVMYFYMSWIYLHLNDGDRSIAWAKKGLEFWPSDLDLNYIMARIGYQAKIESLLVEHSKKYFELLPALRSRGLLDVGKFENKIDCNTIFNRTIYTVDEAAEQSMRQFLKEAGA